MVEFCQGDENSTSSNLTRLPAFWIIVSISLSSNGWERYSCSMCEKLGLLKSHLFFAYWVVTQTKSQLTRLSLAISRLRLQPLLKQQVTSPRMMEVDHFRSDPSEGFLLSRQTLPPILNNSHHFQHFSPILNLSHPFSTFSHPFRLWKSWRSPFAALCSASPHKG